MATTFQELVCFLDKYKNDIDDVRAVPWREIDLFEQEYNLALPADYREFLHDYGILGIWGIGFSGLIEGVRSNEPCLQPMIEEIRSKGLEAHWVPVLRDELDLFLMNSNTGEVYRIDPGGDLPAHEKEYFADSFSRFMLRLLRECEAVRKRLGDF